MIMKILGLARLDCLQAIESTRTWLVAWTNEVRQATWRQPTDVLVQFPSAQPLETNRILFLCTGTRGAIEVQFAFPQGIALVILATNSGDPRGS